ncbi:MAG: DUF4340 domain-containing protein [Cyclobacteriaceae bacterium]|nr:DUF4340 domain-containing protein [Cyclobacteriaceae bacterium]
MPRNIKLLISLIGLLVLVVAMFYFSNRDTSGIDKSVFEIVDQDRIDRVTMTSNAGTTELKFEGTKWRVNAAYDADRQLVTVLFATVVQTQPKRKLTGAQRDSVSKKMSRDGVRVLLSEDETPKKEFLVCGNEEKTETYYQLVGEEAIYLVTIPGYRVYVASIFELNETGWRDKVIFNFNWQNFKELKVHFPKRTDQDFSVSLVNNLFSIAEVSVTDTTKLSGFLESMFKLQAEQILSKTESKRYDSLLGIPPVVELALEDISKKNIALKIYPLQKGSELVVARINDSETVLLSPRATAVLSRGRDFFVMK